MTREVGTDARARKRERDKQNQRQRRRRERDAFEELQRKNDLLEKQIKALSGGNQSDVQSLSDTVQQLEKHNKELKERLESVDHFVKSWSNLTSSPVVAANKSNGVAASNTVQNGVGIPASQVSSPAGSTPIVTSATHTHSTLPEYFSGKRATSIPSDWSGSIASPVAERGETAKAEIKVPEHRLQRVLSLPEWARVPINLSSSGRSYQAAFDPFGGITDRIRSSPESLAGCTPFPSPMHLLYGDSSNELANWIASVTYPNPSRRTEKLAYQWYTYIIARWIMLPSEETFSRIPHLLRPTPRQLCIPHAPIFDFIAWPQVRDNFIETGTKYCRPEVFGLLFVTCRLKDTPNGEWVVRDENDEPQVDPDFIARFSNVENWVILDRFWKDYPELVKGLDPAKYMISEQDLV